MKYEIAWSNRHNCTNKSDHRFGLASKEQRAEIIKEHPKFDNSIAIWICYHCGKIIQSM